MQARPDDRLLTTEEVMARYHFRSSRAAIAFMRAAGGGRVGGRVLAGAAELEDLRRRRAADQAAAIAAREEPRPAPCAGAPADRPELPTRGFWQA